MFPRRARAVVVVCVVASVLGPGGARASQTLGDLDVSNVSLAVNANGEALVTYTRRDGRRRHVLAWGAVNARTPSPDVPQVRFSMDYTGGQHEHHNPGYWQTFHGRCPSYHGPTLVYVVAACTAPDGSYWAVQAWQKNLPMRGIAPFRPEQAAFVFDLSHWTGPTAVLEVSQNFTYGGTWTGLFGRMTYGGAPVFGYRTPSSSKRGDGYARYAYIDTHDSAYGPGWRHDAAKVLHLRNGAFCYSFVPQVPPPGYPDRSPRGPGNGDFERVTVLGPGVTPDVQWVGPGLGAYDPVQDEAFNALFDRLVGPDDQVCKNER
jgi:hypothetical protein